MKLSKRYSQTKIDKRTEHVWGAKTICRKGYLVQVCGGHRAAKVADGPAVRLGIKPIPAAGGW